jgi:hypothetical protein
MVRRRHDLIAVRGERGAAAVAGPHGTGADEVVPEAFRWRGRRYVVTEVLGQWVEAAAWWRPGAAETVDVAATSQPVRQRRWWRVSARPTHPATQGATGVYELCCSGGTWSLRRVHD